MGVQKWMVVFLGCFVASAAESGGPCDSVLVHGIFGNVTKVESGSAQYAAALELLCSTEVRASRSTKGFGLGGIIPIEGLPLDLGVDYSGDDYDSFSSEHCRNSSSTSFSQGFYKSLSISADPTIKDAIAAWQKCQASGAWCGFIRQPDGTGLLQLRVQPAGLGEELSGSVSIIGAECTGAGIDDLSAFPIKSRERFLTCSTISKTAMGEFRAGNYTAPCAVEIDHEKPRPTPNQDSTTPPAPPSFNSVVIDRSAPGELRLRFKKPVPAGWALVVDPNSHWRGMMLHVSGPSIGGWGWVMREGNRVPDEPQNPPPVRQCLDEPLRTITVSGKYDDHGWKPSSMTSERKNAQTYTVTAGSNDSAKGWVTFTLEKC